MKKTISFVTITRDDPEGLENTLASIAMQKNCRMDEIEVIVINGNPDNQKTLDVIEKYKDLISGGQSKKDGGIYNAMNIGMKHAKGEYYWFMNGGDVLPDENTLGAVQTKMDEHPEADFIFGDFINAGKPAKAFPDKDYTRANMVTCHQAMLFQASSMKPYDESYKIAGDFRTVLEVYSKAEKPLYIQEPLAFYKGGGISETKRVQGMLEVFRARKEVGLINFRDNMTLTFVPIASTLIKENLPGLFNFSRNIFRHHLKDHFQPSKFMNSQSDGPQN